MIKLLFLGDIVGRPGRSFAYKQIPKLREDLALDFVVVNAENAAGGSGLNARIANELKEAGVDAITLGDHTWDQRGFDVEIKTLEHVCRPANLPVGAPGRDRLVVEKDGVRLAVFTVLGYTFIRPKTSCAFRMANQIVEELAGHADIILTEIHAEATSEKVAMGWYLDGRVSAVLGTHTHIPTADCRVLPRGTAYQTDVGMSGSYTSVLGREIQPVIAAQLDGIPRKFPVAEGDVRLCGTLMEIDPSNGACTRAERFELAKDAC